MVSDAVNFLAVLIIYGIVAYIFGKILQELFGKKK